MTAVPRLVLAAPASGAGKTTVATGLMGALRARGLAVSPHKVGPDYIDPGYHALATGRPGRNLDPVLCGEERIAPLFLHGARDADLAVVEGVMGLYDGRGSSAYGSTAHVARLLDAPVVLVVDASSMSRSVAALVHGFATFEPGLRIAGVVLNRVASDRHEQLLREVLDLPVLGVLRRDDSVSVPSRHLGLVPAAERAPEAVATVDRLAALAARSLDLDALLAVARSAGPLRGTAWQPQRSDHAGARPVVAVFAGAAFTFAYAELPEQLTAAGCDVVAVDPLHDEDLPAGCAGLVLPGGFPELHTAGLAANDRLLARVRAFAEAGRPVYAECAGLLYLCAELDGIPMAGVLPATAAMTPTLSLGYREVVAPADTLLARRGERVTAHEFHRTRTTPDAGAAPAWRSGGGDAGFGGPTLVASYLHLHPAGTPAQVTRFAARCAA